jgi:hypothetical protein
VDAAVGSYRFDELFAAAKWTPLQWGMLMGEESVFADGRPRPRLTGGDALSILTVQID